VNEIAVLGAGNGGCACAADLSLKGFKINLFNRWKKQLYPIKNEGGITLKGEAGEGFAKLNKITTDLEEAISDAEIIVIAVPAFGHEYFAKNLATILQDHHKVLLNPGSSGGSLHFLNKFRNAGGHANFTLGETSTLTYAARKEGPSTVEITNIASNLPVSALPSSKTSELCDALEDIFSQHTLVQAKNVLETSLRNLNAIEHPPAMLLNAGWIEHTAGDFNFYYEGTTPAVARLMEAIDEEIIEIGKVYDINIKPFIESFYETGYTTKRAKNQGSILEAFKDSAPNRYFKAPSDLEHRYIREDVGYGLIPSKHLAELDDVSTPAISSAITIASIITDINFSEEGRTKEKMGIDGFSKESLLKFVETGEAP